MLCPACGHDNIDGIDTCEECCADLRHEDLPRARTQVERQIMEMPVSSLTAREPTRLVAQTSLREAIQTMRDEGHGCVLVVDDEQNLIGIFTERDVLSKIARSDVAVDLDRVQVGELATMSPETIRPEDNLQFALNRMAINGFRHLPIDGPSTCGLITARDILDFIETNFRETVTRAFKRPSSFKG